MGIKPTQFPPQAVEGAISFITKSVPFAHGVNVSDEVRYRQCWSYLLKPHIIALFKCIEKAITAFLYLVQVSSRHLLRKQLQQYDRYDILCSLFCDNGLAWTTTDQIDFNINLLQMERES